MYHDNGERADMYRQYLKPAERRENLTVLKQARCCPLRAEPAERLSVVCFSLTPLGCPVRTDARRSFSALLPPPPCADKADRKAE